MSPSAPDVVLQMQDVRDEKPPKMDKARTNKKRHHTERLIPCRNEWNLPHHTVSE